MNAAREGVDRLGTPTLPIGGGESASSSPQPTGDSNGQTTAPTSNLNENLKNFGKFFRRDTFGRFGKTQ